MATVLQRSTLLLLSATLAVAIPLTVPRPAHAQTPSQTPCLQWDVSQGWYAIQANGYQVLFALSQAGTGLKGTGEFATPSHGMVFGSTGNPQPVSGTLNGDSIEIDTSWGGVYLGKLDLTGRIDGTTYDRRNSSSGSTWYSDRRMNCLRRAGDPPPAPAASTVKTPPPTISAGAAVAGTVRAGSPAANILASRSGTVTPIRSGPSQPDSPIAHQAPTVCKSGYVWRVARPSDLVCVSPQSRDRVAQENRSALTRIQPGGGPYGPKTCRSGFVWREAYAGDTVCVTPQVRDLVRQENQLASSRVQ